MRTVEIAGEKITVNHLTRQDFEENDLKKYGFGFFGYKPVAHDDPSVDEEGILLFVKLATGIAEVPKTFGPKHWFKLYAECIKETYGAEDEEKN